MEIVIEKIIGWGIPLVCGGLLGALVSLFTMMKSIKNGVQCLLRAEIITQHEKWEKRGFCPIYAKEALSREYKAYHKLGGNDVATSLYDETMHLPEELTKRKEG